MPVTACGTHRQRQGDKPDGPAFAFAVSAAVWHPGPGGGPGGGLMRGYNLRRLLALLPRTMLDAALSATPCA